jgi:hypothetical protein
MSDDKEIETSQEAAVEFKRLVNELMKGLKPIVARYDKRGWEIPDISSLLKSATSSGSSSITKIFEDGLTPTQKFVFAQAWAQAMDAQAILPKFIKSTKQYWTPIEDGTEQEQEQALLQIVQGLDIPGNGAQFLNVLYHKKELLTASEKKAVISFFQSLTYYAHMYDELKAEEGAKKSKKHRQ